MHSIQETFIVWYRSRFYSVIKELNCKDLLSFYLLGVLHSLHITPDANSFGAVEGQKPKVGSVAGKNNDKYGKILKNIEKKN